MKKTAPDIGRQPSYPECKDKQTLVLFVLACGLLLSSISLVGPPSPTTYAIEPLPDRQEWRITRLGEGRREGASRPGNPNVFYWQSDSSPYDSILFDDTLLPARFHLLFNHPLPINMSRQEELEMLPRIGPRLAATIVQVRQTRGRFNTPDDLLEVPGIGPVTLERILPLVSFQ